MSGMQWHRIPDCNAAGAARLIDKDINCPDRIVLRQMVFEWLGKTKCSDCGHRQRQSASFESSRQIAEESYR
jgi:hypothetical protein